MLKTLPRLLKDALEFEGTKLRCDCPVCGGDNSFSATKDGNCISFMCFRAACGVRGAVDHEPTISDLNNMCLPATKRAPFIIPDYFSASLTDICISYLEKHHCWDAYKEGRAEVLYDPKQDRICFIIYDNGVCYGASGRSLSGGVGPKWYIYNDGGIGFLVGCRDATTNGPISAPPPPEILLVEDCASACASSSIMDSLALLGTNLHARDYDLIKQYKKAYVALDKDATVKALDIQKNLSYLLETVVVPLERDLKYLNQEEITKVFYGPDSNY